MEDKKQGFLFIISGPSGAGKTTLCDMLLKKYPDLKYSISTTTRSKRGNEKDRSEYYFVSDTEFQKMITEDDFLEWALVHGAHYGTRKSFVLDNINNGKDVLLEIDVQGGLQIKGKFPKETVLVFVAPPDHEELFVRLKNRSTDTDEVIQKRIMNAKKEMKYISSYEYKVVNDDVETSFEKLSVIYEAEHYKVNRIKS